MRSTRFILRSFAPALTFSLFAALVLAWPATPIATSIAAQERSEFCHQYFVSLPGPDGVQERALVSFPRRSDGRMSPVGRRYPLVVALHGRGESAKGPSRGTLGWNVDYLLPLAYGAIARGRLERVDYRTFVTDRHLAAVNAELAARTRDGVMVVTPYVPDLLAPNVPAEQIARYGEWITAGLLPAVRRAYPQAAQTRAGTGIDGVSLGGRIALEVGFAHADAFGAVGAIQPAITGETERLATLGRTAGEAHGAQAVRLLTSEGDPFLAATRELSTELQERRIPHTLLVLPGPHDYEFNRGPGAIELLRFGQNALDGQEEPGLEN
jgi:iron(III)-salmochelin esterase